MKPDTENENPNDTENPKTTFAALASLREIFRVSVAATACWISVLNARSQETQKQQKDKGTGNFSKN